MVHPGKKDVWDVSQPRSTDREEFFKPLPAMSKLTAIEQRAIQLLHDSDDPEVLVALWEIWRENNRTKPDGSFRRISHVKMQEAEQERFLEAMRFMSKTDIKALRDKLR